MYATANDLESLGTHRRHRYRASGTADGRRRVGELADADRLVLGFTREGVETERPGRPRGGRHEGDDRDDHRRAGQPFVDACHLTSPNAPTLCTPFGCG